MVPLFYIWFLFSQIGTGIQKMVLLFYLSKRHIKGSRTYRNWWKRSGLIFFWCTFSFMISPPAFFSIFKIKNRRKGSGKRADKRSRQKNTCENRYHNFRTINFQKSDFQIPHSTFRLHAHSTVQIQFLKIQFSNYRCSTFNFQNQQIQIRQLNFFK